VTARVTANGREFEVDGTMTVAEFVRSRGLDPRYVVVELADGDRLELVRAVAGGS
jgi:sulfur carrier protein ThiS